MLVDSRKVKDLKAVYEVLHILARDTDGRYSQEIVHIEEILKGLLQKVTAEEDLAHKIGNYKYLQFDVKEILRKRYTNYNGMMQELKDLLNSLGEIKKILPEYDKLKSSLEPKQRRDFEVILRQPAKHRELLTLWNKIR